MLNYTEYQGYGGKADEPTFDSNIRAAEIMISREMFNKDISSLSSDIQNVIKEAIYYQVDFMIVNGGYNEMILDKSGIASENIGSYGISYRETDGENKYSTKGISKLALMLLDSEYLRFMGV